MDRVPPVIRSKIMAAVKTSDTGPELLIRKSLHRLGFRYALHRRDLPGKPDLVFPSRKKIIFVHGCLWHGHSCSKGKPPKSRISYWLPKIDTNRRRDSKAVRKLRRSGWSVMTVWQCETRDIEKIVGKIARFLRTDQQRLPSER